MEPFVYAGVTLLGFAFGSRFSLLASTGVARAWGTVRVEGKLYFALNASAVFFDEPFLPKELLSRIRLSPLSGRESCMMLGDYHDVRFGLDNFSYWGWGGYDVFQTAFRRVRLKAQDTAFRRCPSRELCKRSNIVTLQPFELTVCDPVCSTKPCNGCCAMASQQQAIWPLAVQASALRCRLQAWARTQLLGRVLWT